MFRALNPKTKEHVIILDPEWTERIPRLRELGRSGQLVCPGCDEPVLVRAGDVYRPHFAHKHRGNCPLGDESVPITESKALLYPWLRDKYGEYLTFEAEEVAAGLPRPIDFYVPVENGCIVFWIIDKRIRPDDRELLHDTFEALDASVQWIFAEEMLGETGEKNLVDLSTTEREFRRDREYDLPYVGPSLHYLFREPPRMRTYRGLQVVHKPQRFEGEVLEDPIDEVRVVPATGEIVHPGEHDKLNTYREKIRRWKQQNDPEQMAEIGEVPIDEIYDDEILRPGWARSASEEDSGHRGPSLSQSGLRQSEEIVCESCGRTTTDWNVRRPNGRGKCRQCVRGQ